MHCFYTDKEQIGSSRIQITGADVNHIKNVLRMNKGERLTVCDGEGFFYECAIRELLSERIEADIIEKRPAQTELPVKITLFQGLPKKDKLELIIQKAVELGADEVIPVSTRFCIAKVEEGKKEKKKLERWQEIARAAAKQCGRGVIPKVGPVMAFRDALLMAKEMDRAVIPYEKAEGVKAAFEEIERMADCQRVGIFIGPEGGFSEEEIEKAKEAGIEPISLGKRILRTETAGLCILSVLMFAIERREPDDSLFG